MAWFSYIFIVLGIILLLTIPFALYIYMTAPMLILRPQWRGVMSVNFAKALGIIIILAALIGGIWTIWIGIGLLVSM